jgi:hypothetical protein
MGSPHRSLAIWMLVSRISPPFRGVARLPIADDLFKIGGDAASITGLYPRSFERASASAIDCEIEPYRRPFGLRRAGTRFWF